LPVISGCLRASLLDLGAEGLKRFVNYEFSYGEPARIDCRLQRDHNGGDATQIAPAFSSNVGACFPLSPVDDVTRGLRARFRSQHESCCGSIIGALMHCAAAAPVHRVGAIPFFQHSGKTPH
jgi:hypothetical protein